MRPARSLLLQSLADVAAQDLGAWPQVLLQAAAQHGMTVQWRGLLADAPAVAAVRVAHALEMGPSGVQAWHAAWPVVLEAPPLQFAAAAAGLLAGRAALLVLAAAVDGSGGDAGALIDGESCARMVVAGFDPDTEVRLGNCSELLASAGDLINLSTGTGADVAPTRFLVLGLKWHAPAGD